MNNVLVHIAENNDKGKRSGFVTQFMFHTENINDCFLHLECRVFEGVEIKQHADSIHQFGTIRMYGVDFKFQDYGDWVGNMMWNQYTMPVSFALGLINLLCRKDDFTDSYAEHNIARKWAREEEITAFDIGINDKTVVQQIIDPNQLNLFK